MKMWCIKIFCILFLFPLSAFSQKGEFIKPAKVKAPVWLGVQLAADRASEPGARISLILRNSPADGMGIRPGDRIVAFENETIPDAASLRKITKQYRDGDKVEIKFLRITTTRKATLTLRAKPDTETIVRRHLIGEKAPPIKFKVGGKTKNLYSAKGKITVVDFWATWCPPCRETDRQLKKTHEMFGDKVAIFSLSTESEKKVNAFIKKYPKTGIQVGIDYENTSETLWQITAYPTVILLDEELNVTSVMFGVKEVDLLNARIKKLLQKKTNE